jgi:crotonobetainyl-CoA:carnitine CoA-transferase CaiB-like acyl-CoA transferase
MCAVGILLALVDRGNTGRGQVVNTDMVMHASSTNIHSSYSHNVDRCREHVTSLLFLSFMTTFRHRCQGGQTFWTAAHLFTTSTLAKMAAGCQSDA